MLAVKAAYLLYFCTTHLWHLRTLATLPTHEVTSGIHVNNNWKALKWTWKNCSLICQKPLVREYRIYTLHSLKASNCVRFIDVSYIQMVDDEFLALMIQRFVFCCYVTRQHKAFKVSQEKLDYTWTAWTLQLSQGHLQYYFIDCSCIVLKTKHCFTL